MALERVHECMLETFEKQKAELPRLKHGLETLQRSSDPRHRKRADELRKKIEDIESGRSESAYLLELGTLIFQKQPGEAAANDGHSPTKTPPGRGVKRKEPDDKRGTKRKAPEKEEEEEVSPKRPAGTSARVPLCWLTAPCGSRFRVSAWMTRTALCESVLSKLTGQTLEGAYAWITINGDALPHGGVLYDNRKLKLANAQQNTNVNVLAFGLRRDQRVWTVQVHEATGASLGTVQINAWCTEDDISKILGRKGGGEDAFFIDDGWVRVRSAFGLAVEEVCPEAADWKEGDPASPPPRGGLVITRVNRVASRRRKLSNEGQKRRRNGKMTDYVEYKSVSGGADMYLDYMSMLDRLSGAGGGEGVGLETLSEPSRQRSQTNHVEVAREARRAAQRSVTRGQRHRSTGKPDALNGSVLSDGVCPDCGGTDVFYVRSESAYVCNGYEEEEIDCEGHVTVSRKACGRTVQVVDNGPSSVPYGTKVHADHSSYRRINHFKEWLSQLQAKERVETPEWVVDAVRLEFQKNRKTTADVNKTRVREYLKKLDKMYKASKTQKFSSFYEHAPQIVERITGVPPPRITPDKEAKLCEFFCRLEPAFESCPAHIKGYRQNFLHYAYVIYKLCELLGYREIMPTLSLLKSKARLMQHDSVWKFMMAYLGLPFYRTV